MRKPCMKDVDVNYNQYTSSHGKMPRGRGSWAFAFWHNYKMEDIFWAGRGSVTGSSMLFGAALKLAKEEALKRGSDMVYVLS